MHVHFLVNPAAGGGRATTRTADVAATLNELGVHVELHRPKDLVETQGRLRGLVDAGARRIIVAGGDGTVHHAVNALAGSESVLGIIPAGTGNDGAGALGLPSDLAEACRAALDEPVAVDVLQAGDRYALCHATFGFTVAANDRADQMSFPKGGLRYTIAPLLELAQLKPMNVTLTIDGVAHERTASMVVIANTFRFGQGMKIAPGADPTDGQADVVVMRSSSKVTTARLLPLVFAGRHVSSRHVEVMRGASIQIDGPVMKVMGDGEELGQTPMTVSVVPQAVKVAGARL